MGGRLLCVTGLRLLVEGLHSPYFGRVLQHSPVAGKLSHISGIENCPARPLVGIGEKPVHLVLSIHIAPVIRQDQEIIAATQQAVHDGREQPSIAI